MKPHAPTAGKKRAHDNVESSTDNENAGKRPARGYHRFKNGVLNVAPKGGEKELVKLNQDSALLSLPPEIRNCIWAYALGGHDFRQVYYPRLRYVFRPKPHERSNLFTILRVCRQIYAETALLPYNVNVFSVHDLSGDDALQVGKSANRLKKYQLSQIAELKITLTSSGVMFPYSWTSCSLNPSKFMDLTGLRRIKIQIFTCDEWKASSFSQVETRLRSYAGVSLLVDRYDLVIEKMDATWQAYHAEWYRKPNAEAY